MKHRRYIKMVLLVTVIPILACGSNFKQYYPQTEIPRMMYIGDEVDSLSYRAAGSEKKQIYVEIRTTKGELETGNLLAITLDEVILTSGYMYVVEDDTSYRVEDQQVVRKNNVSIMKVW